MRYLDLTHTFVHGMPVYPGDPAPTLTPTAALHRDGYVDHQLTTGMHAGTHIDAPLHLLAGGKYLSEISIEQFIGRGHLVDARGNAAIDAELLASKSIQRGDIVLIMTGWYKKFGQPEYYEKFPAVSEPFARQLVARGVKVVGLDTPSPDRPPFAIHKLLLRNGILIIENLTNLEGLLGHSGFQIFALPAKLHTDAAPVRVVAGIT